MQRALWWARDYAYAAKWQVRAFVDRTDAASFHTGSGTPILVIPGVYETWKFLQPLIVALHERGHQVHVVEPLARNRRPVLDAAKRVHAHLLEHDLTDVVIVGHSKGGLIGKQVMLGPSAARIRSMLAVAAPFGGSRYARVMLVPTLRGLSPRNTTIRDLHKQEAVNHRIVSIFAEFDPHIPEGSALPGATNIELDAGGHFRILADPRVIAEATRLAE